MKAEDLIIGLMSGTSLDGLDIAVCSFEEKDGKWAYRIHHAETMLYDAVWQKKLAAAHRLSEPELEVLDREYGRYLGEVVNKLCQKMGIRARLIASHGHTVFHAPEEGVTKQIGAGTELAELTQSSVVYDFRSLDVSKGGQGAPLVPVGDMHLFGEFDACLNLGGYSNISFDWQGRRIAFDICPVNSILNHLAGEQDQAYDRDGNAGRRGRVDEQLVEKLNALPYYTKDPPKSLGREWLESGILPLIEQANLPVEDKLASLYRHIAEQITAVAENYRLRRVLVSGGGARNKFLLEQIRQLNGLEWIKAGDDITDFKEALIFAFLGLLRLRGEVNCLASVTGASSDTVAGTLIEIKKPRIKSGA